MKEFLAVSAEVREALAARRPVVALESTIISHGMPYPKNVDNALALESIARAMGAVPATIAVLGGKLTVGLSRDQIERLGTAKGVWKASRRDLAAALATGRDGATTVAATMIGARLAGIGVFATGGIGGAHRGAGESFDVSADMTELARSGVCVVSAGAKAILDLPKTLEILETLGVPVIGFGTDEFPAFYSRASGLPAGLRADTAAEVASIVRMQRALGLEQGILVANPVPVEYEIPRGEIDGFIGRALADMEARGIRGKAVTPFLLARIVELSGGRSLETNRRLVENNVRLACAISRELVAENA
jgi:pseudouridylate synthase